MALELVGGTVLGEGASELLNAITGVIDQAMSFKPFLERLKKTLEELVIPNVGEIERKGDNRSVVQKLKITLSEGKILVEKCSAVPSWNYYLKSKYARTLQELDNSLIRIFTMDVPAAILGDVELIKNKMNDLELLKDQMNGVTQKLDVLAKSGGSGYNPGVGAEAGAGAETEAEASNNPDSGWFDGLSLEDDDFDDLVETIDSFMDILEDDDFDLGETIDSFMDIFE